MEKDYFINGAIPNPPFQFQSTTMWQSCLFNPDQLDSIVSSPYIGTNNCTSTPKLHMPNSLGLNKNAELPQKCTQPLKLSRISSSPSLKQARCLTRRANESVSEPRGSKLISRKVSRAKTKEGGEADDDSARAKRCKLAETVNVEELKDINEIQKPPKDYIHVRARRGQATDSHSLAERVRREKISERMKLLQDLVPGCNKVTGKALMLDEIINYVQSLQRQVEFLSMKLSSVNPSCMDFPLSKDICQPNGSIPQPVLPVNKTASALPSYQHNDIPNGALSQCSVDTSLCRSLGMQFPPLDGFAQYLNQFPTMCEDDLQSIVQMGFSQTSNKDVTLQSQGFPGPYQTSHMKIEM